MKLATRSLLVTFLTISAVGLASDAQAQAPDRNALQAAGHWCTFNRPCNWATHASIAFGTAYLLDRADVPLEYAAGAGAALFLGKEIRDHMIWGDFWTRDSLIDLAAGFVGAFVAYKVLDRSDDSGLPSIFYDPEAGAGLSVELSLP